jgi:hypothetical protein
MQGFFDGLINTIKNPKNAANIALGTGALGAIYSGYNKLGGIGTKALTEAEAIGDKGVEQTEFKPFSITSSTGGMFNVDSDGATTTLSPQEQQYQQMMMDQAQQAAQIDPFGQQMGRDTATNAYGFGQGFMTQAGMDTGAREQDIYDTIRAMQNPEEERQRMALEERLYNQGRSGVLSNMYGGTPEQLAMAKAQAEAQNQASLMAMQQGQAEQLQQANLGNMYAGLGSGLSAQDLTNRQNQQGLGIQALGASYAPQNQMLTVQQGTDLYPQLNQRAQFEGAGLYGEANMGGIEALLGAGQGQANLLGTLGSGLLSGIFKK